MKKLLMITTAAMALGLAAGANAQDAAKLAQDKACLACHQIDKKLDRKSTRLNSSHSQQSRMPSSA